MIYRANVSYSEEYSFHPEVDLRTCDEGVVVGLTSRKEPAANVDRLPGPLTEFQRGQLLGCLRVMSEVKRLLVEDLQVLAFGSVVTGRCRAHSDVDMVLVSNRFVDIFWSDRVDLVKGYFGDNALLISPLGMTYSEIEGYKYPAIIRYIREHHIQLL